MSPALKATLICACLAAAIWAGTRVRRLLPEHHLGADTKDTVKVAMGLVATMSALLLGLLVSSAKGAYDNQRTQVIQIAAKVVFLDRVLSSYGPEAAAAREALRTAVGDSILRVWPDASGLPSRLDPDHRTGDAFFFAIQHLAPTNELQQSLKAQATSLAFDVGQLRVLLMEESVASISIPMLVVVVLWLVVIFTSFSLLAPPNATAMFALLVSALAVAGALFLILELDEPFNGLIRISSQPMLTALGQLTP